jgi:hypothetical protein
MRRYGFDSTDFVVRPFNTGSDDGIRPVLDGKKALSEIAVEMLQGRRPPPSRFSELKRRFREGDKEQPKPTPTNADRERNVNRFLRTGQTP